MAAIGATEAGEGAVRRAVEAFVDRLAASRPASAAAILIVALVAFLPGLLAIEPIDRNETRHALAAQELVLGDPPGGPTLLDPPGFVWLDAAVVSLAGERSARAIALYRAPSVAAAVVAALLTWWMALAFNRPRAALLAGLLMAANFVLAGSARLAAPDALTLACVTLAMGALARLWHRPDPAPRTLLVVLFWAAVGLGVLSGGAAAPLIAAATIIGVSLDKRSLAWLSRLRPLLGVPVMLAVIAPWPAAALLGFAAAPPPGLAAGFDPGAPPGTYALLFFALFWPGASFFVLGLPWIVERLRQPAILFAVAWGGPWWLFMELWPEKLPEYVLPALPAVALLAGSALDRGRVEITGWISRFFSFGMLLFVACLVIGAPLIVVGLIDDAFPMAAAPGIFVAALLAGVAWYWLNAGAQVAASAAAILAAVASYAAIYGAILPSLDRLQIAHRAVQTAERVAGCPTPALVAAGYAEPGLAFLSRGGVSFVSAAGAADALAGPGCRVAVVEARQIASFRQRAEDLGVPLDVVGRIPGTNTGSGRRVVLRLFVAGPQEAGR